jgi:hypothetical protein
MEELKTSLEANHDGLFVTIYPHGVVNINRHVGDLCRADVDAARAKFLELGYEETDSWIPLVGSSWLSDGVRAGVSFRIRKVQVTCNCGRSFDQDGFAQHMHLNNGQGGRHGRREDNRP